MLCSCKDCENTGLELSLRTIEQRLLVLVSTVENEYGQAQCGKKCKQSLRHKVIQLAVRPGSHYGDCLLPSLCVRC